MPRQITTARSGSPVPVLEHRIAVLERRVAMPAESARAPAAALGTVPSPPTDGCGNDYGGEGGTVAAAPPHWHGLTVIDTVAAGAGVVLAMGLSLLGPYALVRRHCGRIRDRLWDDAWARFDNDHRIGS